MKQHRFVCARHVVRSKECLREYLADGSFSDSFFDTQEQATEEVIHRGGTEIYWPDWKAVRPANMTTAGIMRGIEMRMLKAFQGAVSR